MTTRKDSAFLFDLDGTLIDSVYQHVIAWREALEEVDVSLSVWKIHRRIGMSGGLFVTALRREVGAQLDDETLARLPDLHAEAYLRHYGGVRPLPGAGELLGGLSEMGIPWAIATSGSERSGPASGVAGPAGGDHDGHPRRGAVRQAHPDLFLTARSGSAPTSATASLSATASGTCSPARRARGARDRPAVGRVRTRGAIYAGAFRVYEDRATCWPTSTGGVRRPIV